MRTVNYNLVSLWLLYTNESISKEGGEYNPNHHTEVLSHHLTVIGQYKSHAIYSLSDLEKENFDF